MEAALVAETEAALLVAERVVERASKQKRQLRDFEALTRGLQYELKELRRAFAQSQESLLKAETERDADRGEARRLERELASEREKCAVLKVREDFAVASRDKLEVGVTCIAGAFGTRRRPSYYDSDDSPLATPPPASSRRRRLEKPTIFIDEKEEEDVLDRALAAEAASAAFKQEVVYWRRLKDTNAERLAALSGDLASLRLERDSLRREAEEDLRPRLRDAEEAFRLLATRPPTFQVDILAKQIDSVSDRLKKAHDDINFLVHRQSDPCARATAAEAKVTVAEAIVTAAEAKVTAAEAKVREVKGVNQRLLDKYQRAVDIIRRDTPHVVDALSGRSPYPRSSPMKPPLSDFRTPTKAPSSSNLYDDLTSTARSFRRTRALLDTTTSAAGLREEPSYFSSSPQHHHH